MAWEYTVDTPNGPVTHRSEKELTPAEEQRLRLTVLGSDAAKPDIMTRAGEAYTSGRNAVVDAARSVDTAARGGAPAPDPAASWKNTGLGDVAETVLPERAGPALAAAAQLIPGVGGASRISQIASRALMGAGAAGLGDVATGQGQHALSDMATEGAGALVGGAVGGAANAANRTLRSKPFQAADMAAVAKALEPTFGPIRSLDELQAMTLGAKGAGVLEVRLDALQNAVVQAAGPGTRVQVPKELASFIPTASTSPIPGHPVLQGTTYTAPLEDVLGFVKTFKANARQVLAGQEPARRFDVLERARTLEDSITGQLPGNAARAYAEFQDVARKGYAVRNYFKAAEGGGIASGPNDSASINLGLLHDALTSTTRGAGKGGKRTQLQNLEEAGLQDLLTAVSRGGPLTGRDVDATTRLIPSLVSAPGPTGRLRVGDSGLPITMTRRTGQVPVGQIPAGASAASGQLLLDSIKRRLEQQQ